MPNMIRTCRDEEHFALNLIDVHGSPKKAQDALWNTMEVADAIMFDFGEKIRCEEDFTDVMQDIDSVLENA